MMQYKQESDKSGLMAFGGEMNFGAMGEQCVADCQKEVRLGFIRKVYGILSMQLLATAIVCALAMKITGTSSPNPEYPVLSFGSFLAGSQMFMFFMFFVDIAVLIGLFMVKNQYPLNMYILSGWTLCFSLSVAGACARAVCDPLVQSSPDVIEPLSIITKTQSLSLPGGELLCAINTPYAENGGNAVIMAAAITAILFLSLTAFTMQSKMDFSFLGAGLFGAVWILMLWGFFMAIFGGSANMMYMYSLAGAVIFSLYIVFDTWLITKKLGPDDYIMAAIDLYLDIVNLFLFILSLLRRD